ncbi:MAG: outer membrane protein assembly factor BamB family protein, partial [Dehalococcoidia bacterium]
MVYVDITALDKTSGQIGWNRSLSQDIYCLPQRGCLPARWSDSDVVNCCVLPESVKEQITGRAESGLTFVIGKPPLSELTYEHRGVTYKVGCAAYGGGTQCGALQALDRQTGDVLWMMTFKERGVNDFSIVDGILYVSTDDGVGAFQL